MRNGRVSYKAYHGRRGIKTSWPAVLLALVLAGAVCFLIPFTAVLAGGRDDIRGEPQIMVIFGCQLRADGPSTLLKDRLDTALAYLEEHPDMTVVVSGAQGSNEPATEAQGMYDYLTAHGVDGGHILLEERSFSTRENVAHSLEALAAGGYDTSSGVVLVSNFFHVARARMLWERADGAGPVSVLAAPSSHPPSTVKMLVREPLALVKSFFFDRFD